MDTRSSTVVCVSASERTWRNLERYCFNAVFRAQRHRFSLAIGFNGHDAEAFKYIDRLEPEHLFIRPNTGHDLANFDNILKHLPEYAYTFLLHDDHWFHDPAWFDASLRLLEEQPEIGVWGNVHAYDVADGFLEYYNMLVGSLGYTEMVGKKFPHFLQGLAGIYRRSAIKEILAMDGVPHLHRSVQIAAQVCERLFSGLLLERGVSFAQIPPGYELYLVHNNLSIVKLKLEEVARLYAAGECAHAEEVVSVIHELRPHDEAVENCIANIRRMGPMTGPGGEHLHAGNLQIVESMTMAPADSRPGEVLQSALEACVSGDLAGGERLLRQFLRRVPQSVDGWFNLGKVLKDQGRLEEAVEAYRTASELQPGDATLFYNTGNVLRDLRRPAEARDMYRKALALNPQLHEAHSNLGVVLEELGDRVAAGESYARALREGADSAGTHYNLAGVLLEQDRYDEADRSFGEAIRLRPDFAEAWVNRGIGQMLSERTGDAVESFRRAIAIRTGFAEAHLNLAVTLLQQGNFAEGWKEYEWRFHTPDGRNPRRHTDIPEWDGSTLKGKTVLLYQEQGLGDMLQCLRFVPFLVRQGARVVVESQPVLHPILRHATGIAHAVGPDDIMQGIDYVCPVFSLPRLFNVAAETIPANVPYLDAGAEMVDRWRAAIERGGKAFRVGIAWTGNPAHTNNRRRSLPVAALRGLLDVPGIEFHSLHNAGTAGDFDDGLHRHDGTLNNLGEVAALMKVLDLVITVDTAFAHLAGGLGVPVWLLLNFGGDWRWMLGRSDSPWYPTMKIFRQRAPGDWQSLLADVHRALEMRAARSNG